MKDFPKPGCSAMVVPKLISGSQRPTEEEGQRPPFWSREIHVQDPRAPFGCGRPTYMPVVRPIEQTKEQIHLIAAYNAQSVVYILLPKSGPM